MSVPFSTFAAYFSEESPAALPMIDELIKEQLPQHVAIIMDGNGRWAKKKGNMRVFGHRNAIKAVRDVTEGAAELGISYLSLFAFSTENWQRPTQEVNALMQLLVSTLQSEAKTLQKNNVRLKAIGALTALPADCQKGLLKLEHLTAANTGLTLVLALNYSGRWDILQASQRTAEAVAKGELLPDQLTEATFSKYLATAGMPEPELLIRTSGEQRISNFMLWQLAYAELYFTDELWPDFRKEHLKQALNAFQQRERRFGKTSEQIKKQPTNA